MSAQEIFEAFVAGGTVSGEAFAELCGRHPGHADELRELWRGYQRLIGLLGAIEEPPAGATPGTRYEVRGEIARGGMGRVLEVWDRELRRTLAMKVLHGRGAGAQHLERARSRLVNEAQILGQLEHPGIVPVHEVGLDGEGRPYFTMLRVRGRALDEVFEDACAGRGGWSLTRAVSALLRVCEAVAHAHDRGVIHRDLKPSNVMVGPFGEVYVMDWGLAKARGVEGAADVRLRATIDSVAPAGGDDSAQTPVSVRTDRRDASDGDPLSPLLTMEGDVVGTPAYMAPEQAAGRIADVDERSDVYGAGAMLYHLLAGRAPYAGAGTPREVLRALLEGPPEPLERLAPRASRELAAICAKAMARDREQRYAGMAELADDLRAYLEGHAVRAYRTGVLVDLVKWARRNKGAAAAVVAVLAGVLTVVVLQARANSALERSAAALRERIYFNDVAAAQVAHARGDEGAMHQLLAGCAAGLRGWEWRCLARTADTSDVTLPFGGVPVVSPDGRTLVIASNGEHRTSELRLVDVASWTSRAVVRHGHYMTWPAFHPDGSRVFAGTWDGYLLVCDVARGTLERKVDARADAGQRTRFSVAVSPDGELLALGRDSGVLDLWSAEELKPVARLDQGIRAVTMSAFSPDGRLLFAAGADKETDHDRASSIRVYDMVTRRRLHVWPGHREWVTQVAPSPDGRWLASAGKDRRILLWDLSAGQAAGRPLGPPRRELYPLVAWSPDGRFLLATAGARVQVWSTRTWTVQQTLVGHWVCPLPAFLADGRVVTCDPESTKVWSLDRRDRIEAVEMRRVVYAAAFSPTGEELALSYGKGHVEIWSVPERRRLRTTGIACERTKLRYTPDGARLLALDRSGRLRIHDVAENEITAVIQTPDNECLAVGPGGRLCATTGGADAKVRVWDLETGELLWSAVASESERWPHGGRGCAFSLRGGLLAVGASDGRVRVLDAESGRLVRPLRVGSEPLWFEAVSFSPDGRRLVAWVRSTPRRLVVWDVASGRVLWDVRAAEDFGGPVFTGDGTRVLTASTGGALIVRNAATGKRIVALEHGEESAARLFVVSPGRDLVAVYTESGELRLWTDRPW